jgi:hypothetical protein
MKNLRSKIILLIMNIFIISSGFAQTCPSGMVSYWKLDDVSDNLFVDYYGNHDASAENSVANVENGKIGAAKSFDGTNVVIVNDHADFNFPVNSSFSIELWVKYSEIVGTRTNIIIGKNDPFASGAYWSIGIENPSGKLFYDLRDGDGNTQTVVTGSALSTNVWHHVVAVRDEATNQNILYLDGIPVGSTVNYDYPGNFTSNGDVNIGFLIRLGIPDYNFKGILDEVAIYNRALSSSEVTEHLSKNNFGIGYCDGYSPSIISTPVTNAVVGQQYTYTVKATGMPTMDYSLVTYPTGMSINNSTGVITWTPASINDNGYIVVRANNNVVPADTQSFRIFLADEPVCPAGILALWKLNETSGPTYVDYYNAHTIEATVAPTATAGKINGGQLFNSSTILDIPDNGTEFDWAYTADFSFEFWMKTSSTATMVVLGRFREDYPNAANFWVGTSNGKANFYLRDNGDPAKEFEISSTASLADNQWHHVIAVREGSVQKNKLYVDGLLVSSVTTNYANSFISDEPTEINLGWFDNTPTGYHFVGALDEVAIFNKAISDAEAASFFNLGAPTGHCAISNYLPVITSTPTTDIDEDVVYTYNFTVEDYDVADLITLNAPTKPSWLSFNYTMGQKSAVLTGTPTNDNVGDHNVLLTVNDGHITREQSFTISVANVNDSAVITSTPVLDGYVGELYAYVFTATDVDNPTITLSAVEIPDWLNFNTTNGILSGTPAQEDKGQHLIILRASDGLIDVDQTFTLTIEGPEGLEDLTAAGISIYPVPAKSYLKVEFGNLNEETQLELISANGRILKQVVISANQRSYTLDLNGYETGMYYLHLKNSKLNNIGRFVISK